MKIFSGKSVSQRRAAIRAHEQPCRLSNAHEPGLGFVTTTPQQRQHLSVCVADAVVLGEVRSGSPHPTASRTFIFTTFEVAVKEPIKESRPAPLRQGDLISVSRPGGTLFIDGWTVRTIDNNHRPLQVGKIYVLFLRYIPETGDYTVPSLDDSSEARTVKSAKWVREAAKTCEKEATE